MLDSLRLPALGMMLALGAPGVSVAADTPRFSGSTAVTVIEVPVQVSRNGQPVRGLTRDDFEVTQNGASVAIVDFDVIDLAGRQADGERRSIPVAARRHFLFLFDLVFSEPKSLFEARKAALELLRDTLHPADLAAVALHTKSGARLVLGFTSDRNQIAAAIATLGAPDQFTHGPDPLALTVASTVNDLANYFMAGDGGKGAGAMFDAFRDYARLTVEGERDQEVDSIVDLSRSLGELAHEMGAIEGRKYVLFLSQGFSNRALVGSGTVSQRQTLNVEQGNIAQIDNDQRYGSSRAQNSLEAMLEAFRRADCVVHTIDIAGARAGGDIDGSTAAAGSTGNKDGLVAMARSTGGDFYDDFNDLGAAFGQLVEKTSVTYLLTIQPDEVRPDGKYHRLKVKLRNGRDGATITHRPGFFAPDPKRIESALETRFASAEKILSGDVGGTIVARALALPFAVPDQPAYVPVLIEVDGRTLLQGASGDQLLSELYVYALSADGKVLDYFVQNLAFDLTKVRAAIESGGLKFYGHLDLPAGSQDLRVLLENRTAGTYALAASTVSIPAANGETPFVLPPLFRDDSRRWLLLREGPEQQRERALPFPFTTEGQPFLPALAPRQVAGEPIDFHIVGHGLGGELKLDVVLLDAASGKPQPTGGLTVQGREEGALGGSDQLAVRLAAPDLPPGGYVLQMTVTDRATGLAVVSSSELEVMPR